MILRETLNRKSSAKFFTMNVRLRDIELRRCPTLELEFLSENGQQWPDRFPRTDVRQEKER